MRSLGSAEAGRSGLVRRRCGSPSVLGGRLSALVWVICLQPVAQARLECELSGARRRGRRRTGCTWDSAIVRLLPGRSIGAGIRMGGRSWLAKRAVAAAAMAAMATGHRRVATKARKLFHRALAASSSPPGGIRDLPWPASDVPVQVAAVGAARGQRRRRLRTALHHQPGEAAPSASSGACSRRGRAVSGLDGTVRSEAIAWHLLETSNRAYR